MARVVEILFHGQDKDPFTYPIEYHGCQCPGSNMSDPFNGVLTLDNRLGYLWMYKYFVNTKVKLKKSYANWILAARL